LRLVHQQRDSLVADLEERTAGDRVLVLLDLVLDVELVLVLE